MIGTVHVDDNGSHNYYSRYQTMLLSGLKEYNLDLTGRWGLIGHGVTIILGGTVAGWYK